MKFKSDVDLDTDNKINLSRTSWITFYGNSSLDHAIGSRNNTGAASDDIRINSYGAVYINLDANSNNTSGADFIIGHHGSSTGTISELFRVSGETGNVGIGTTSPDAKLEISDATNDNLRIGTRGGNMNLFSVTDAGAGSPLAFEGSQFNFITGNVGIGTTAPVGKLSVNEAGSGVYFTRSSGDNGTNAPVIGFANDSTKSIIATAGDGLIFRTRAIGGSAFAGSEAMRITSAGNVGIGTTNPVQPLQVNGNIYSSDGDFYVNANRGIKAVGSLVFSYNDGSSYYEGMRITNAGNVGIGTTAPAEKLHVEGSVLIDAFNQGSETGIFFREGFTAANKYNLSILAYDHDNAGASPDGLSINSSEAISFCTGSNTRNERMRVTGTGALSFGTAGTGHGTSGQVLTSAGNASPTWTTPTTGSGTVTSVAASIDGDGLSLTGTPITTSGTLAFLWTGDSTEYINGAGDVTAFPTIPQGDITGVTAGTGMTGGGTSGAVTLNVIGGTGITANADDIAIDATVATLAGTQTFTNKSGSNSQWTNDEGYTDLVVGTAATDAKAGDTTTITSTQAANIVTNNAKVSNVTQTTVSGNAGSATVLQNARTIAGVSFNGSANISLNNNAITNGAGYTTNTGDITGVTAGTGMSGGGNSGAVTLNCTIDTPGEVGLGNLSSSGNALAGAFTATGDITAFSDERLKANIETIPDALEKVKALRGVTFDKDGKRGLGVIAQEVEKILPEVVMDGEEYKSVAYGNIVGVLIEAVKEQQKQISELKEKIDGLTK